MNGGCYPEPFRSAAILSGRRCFANGAHSCVASSRFPVVCRAYRAQAFGGLLGSQAALSLGHHLVTDHEFADAGRTQEQRIEMRVQLPVVIRALVERVSLLDDATGATHRSRFEQGIARSGRFRCVGSERCKIVGEDKCPRTIGITLARYAPVARAKIAVRVVLGGVRSGAEKREPRIGQ